MRRLLKLCKGPLEGCSELGRTEPPTREAGEEAFRGHLLWAIGFLLVLAVHVCWEWLNERPLVWDMAYHQIMGWKVSSLWQEGNLFSQLTSVTTYYPPLYYLQEAFFLRFLGSTQYLALLTNFLGLFLLSYFTFRITFAVVGTRIAAVAGWIVLLFPLVAWTSRESLLDVNLAGWVALSLYLLLSSRGLADVRKVLLFGACAGLGMLAKWTFIIFVAPAVLIGWFCSDKKILALRNLVLASLLALPLAGWWYLPNLSNLARRFGMTAAQAVWEQDPSGASLQGWLYYLRIVSSYYLFLPLTVFLVWGGIRALRRGRKDGVILWLTCSVGVSLLLLTILETKDPRYVLPVASFLAVLLVLLWKDLPGVLIGVVGLAFVQFLSISFRTPWTPEKISLWSIENDTEFLSVTQEWVFYEPDYFGVLGPAVTENWQLEGLLDRIPDQARVGFVPDLPFFHTGALELSAIRHGKRVDTQRLGNKDVTLIELAELDWVVGKTGHQGFAALTRSNDQVYDLLSASGWEEVEAWVLPDSSQAVLYKRP